MRPSRRDPRDPEVVGVQPDDVGQPVTQMRGASLSEPPGTGTLDRVLAEVRQAQVL